MSNFFENFSAIVLFLHIFSAIVWIGGMVVLRFAVHYSMQKIEEPQIKLSRVLDNLKRFFNLVIPSIIIIVLTAIIMTISLNLKGNIVVLKEIILSIMVTIFIVILYIRNKAQTYFNNKDFKSTKNSLEILSKYLIPINLLLGVVQVYLGVVLRGF